MLEGQRHRWSEEHGITALEYSLLAVLIAIALIGGASAFGGKLNTSFSNISTHVKAD